MDEYTEDIMQKMLGRPDTPPVVRALHDRIKRNLSRVRGFRNPIDMPLLFLACVGAMYELNWLFVEAPGDVHQEVLCWWDDVPRGAPVKLNWHGMREGKFFGFTNNKKKMLKILVKLNGSEKLVDIRMKRVGLLREAKGGGINTVANAR